MSAKNRAILRTEEESPRGEKPKVRQACGKCHGRGLVQDDDPYADRQQMTTCPNCGGSGYIKALIACALLWLSLSAQAATVTGTLQARNGQLVSTNVSFLALQRPLIAPPYVRPGWTYNTNSASNGTFSVFLHAGNYRVTFGSQAADSVVISVPDNTNSYDIGSITTTAITFAHSVPPSTYPLMRGATSGIDGASGLVLRPVAGQQNLFWRGDGTWAPAGGGGSAPTFDSNSSGQPGFDSE